MKKSPFTFLPLRPFTHLSHLSFLTILTFVSLSLTNSLSAQIPNPTRFQNEVDQISQRPFLRQPNKTLALFTGSSSIRLWTSVQDDFPWVQAINTGFGGSTMEELLHYREELIFAFSPDQVIIYEGDNDIALEQSTERILKATNKLISQIRTRLPETEIILISAKPSMARWDQKDQYLDLNEGFRELAKGNKKIKYADIWKPMLGKDGKPRPELFVEDQLHMNPQGYEIWHKRLRKLIRK